MGKNKKKHKKQDSVSDNVFDATALSIKKYRKVTNELAKLSPGQKLLGGLLLAAAGYFYYKNLRDEDWQDSPVAGLLPVPLLPLVRRAAHAPQSPAEPEPAEVVEPTPPVVKKRKATKTSKHAGSFGKKAAASPDEE
ncbi:hypothetical protein EJV47_24115 [Hymenobacter gummosus]|uniref:Uncharacterized protein n=1 Tax=Hymenobacter gummosus TaxID=1776032 RepID=A0A3S0JAZ4_9BACT|nr:hypothetical protein [Hymenobacter gummosus]RTQ45918.1 hypothetical protein EJV47_24115 [Hymenobacter gummosus]